MRSIVLLCTACSGCIAVSAGAHVDVISDVEHHGAQVGVHVGFGYAGERSAVIGNLGLVTGTAPVFGVHDTIDYVHIPEQRLGWRAGFGGTAGIVGDPSIAGLRLATLYSLRERNTSSNHEKLGGSSSQSIVALAFETTVGAVRHVHEDAPPRIGGSAGVGIELYQLSRIWF